MPRGPPLACFFDGACRGNQFARKGPMWVAYVIGDEEHVHEIPDLPTDRGPQRSNNIAEYRALILLLRRLRELAAARPREAPDRVLGLVRRLSDGVRNARKITAE